MIFSIEMMSVFRLTSTRSLAIKALHKEENKEWEYSPWFVSEYFSYHARLIQRKTPLRSCEQLTLHTDMDLSIEPCIQIDHDEHFLH